MLTLKVHDAAKKVFGEHVLIKECFYYLSQNIYRKVQNLSLCKRYKKDKNFKVIG